MSTIPTTGANLWSVTSPYPWSGDPNFTNAWVADRQYIDNTSTVGTWSPQKGSLSWTASGTQRGSWSAAYGSQNRGMVSLNGTTNLMTCDALSALVTSYTDFTLFISFNFVSTGSIKDLISFSGTSDTSSATSLQIGNQATPSWRAAIQDDGSASLFKDMLTLGVPADTNRHVWVAFVNAPPSGTTPPSIGQRLDGVQGVGGGSSIGTWTTETLSRATIGAFRGATTSAFAAVNIRAILFSPFSLAASAYTQVEKYLISETV